MAIKRLIEASDLSIAEECLPIIEKDFCYVDTHDWMWYNGSFWVPNSGAKLRLRIGQIMREIKKRWHSLELTKQAQFCTANRARVQSVAAWLGDHLRVEGGIQDFDNGEDYINVSNGLLNLRTGKLEDHRAKQRYTYCLPWRYRENASQVEWVKFLRDVVPDNDSYEALQVAVGYSLTGSTKEERMFYIWGPPRSGKGVFTETLAALLTENLSAAVDFSSFTKNRDTDTNGFDLAPLTRARLLVASESSKNMRLNEAQVKHMTGGDTIRCRFIYHDPFEFKPQYKAWLVSNYDINADPYDDGVWSRLVRFDFPTSHLGKEDKSLKTKLRTKENLEGLLAWAVEGAIKWYSRGLIIPDILEKKVAEVRDDLDMVQAWLDECTRVGTEKDFASHGALRESYGSWSKEHGYKGSGSRDLSKVLRAKGYLDARTSKQRGFAGIIISGGRP